MFKLKKIVSKQTMRLVYFALYQSNFQYGLLVWGGLRDNIINHLIINQNNIVRICLNKLSLKGSTLENYKELGVLPVRQLYKKIAIMFIIKQLGIDQLHSDNSHIREIRKYDCPVKYTYKSFGQTFVDYLGPTYYNSMPLDFKRNIITSKKINNKGLLYKYIFLEMNNNVY
jgi:hypothetical protein